MSLKVVVLSLLNIGFTGVALTGGYLYFRKDSLQGSTSISESNSPGVVSVAPAIEQPNELVVTSSEIKKPETEEHSHKKSCSLFQFYNCFW